MQTVYYRPMPKLLPCLLLLCIAATAQPPNPQQTSNSHQTSSAKQTALPSRLPYFDSHEGMIIGVDPWLTASRYKEKFPKKSPFAGGIVALHMSFHNDNEKGVKVSLQNIRLIVQLDEDNRQELQPLSADDVADTVLLKPKDPTLRRSPLPIPQIGLPKTDARDSKWTDFRDTVQNAAVPSGVIGAHETVEGLVYFDIRGELDILQNSRLYVPNLITMDNNEPISYFDIALGHGNSETNSQ
jgi:hypothetical protein